MNDIRRLTDEYRRLLVVWSESASNPAAANRLFEANHGVYKQLRVSESGRASISSLMSDPMMAVRLVAATDSLAWNCEEAQRTLEAIQFASDSGLLAVDAEYTLLSWRNGTLDLDW